MGQPADAPPVFREQDVLYIADLVRDGESCALVGIGSSGKSRLVQSLLDPKVRQYGFGEEWLRYLMVHVDGNGLLEDSAWGFYEEMLDSMISMIETLDHPNSEQALSQLNAEHVRLIDGDARLAFRWLAHAVRMLFRVMDFKRIAFMLDDVDHLLRADRLDPLLFRHLKSLRDHHKYRLCYVIATRFPLAELAGERLPEIDGFYKLVKLNTRALGLYTMEDSYDMVRGLMERTGFELPRRVQTLLVYGGGRHPGLMRAIFFALLENERWERLNDERAITEAIKQTIYTDPAVQDECYQIWDALNEDERLVLARAASGKRPTDVGNAVASLLAKSLLLEKEQGRYEVFSPVFAEFVRQDTPGSSSA